MCKTCVCSVHTLSKKLEHEHILCTCMLLLRGTGADNRQLPTGHTQCAATYFSTPKHAIFPPFSRTFSTLYTAPITNTTTYINK